MKALLYLTISASLLQPMFATAADNLTPTDLDSDSIHATVNLDEVGITGHKSADARRTLSATPVYNRDLQLAAPLQTLESALRTAPGIDIRERGAKGAQADIMVRGGSFDQTMVKLNGIDFTDARTGHQSHSLPIDLNSVSGIALIDGVAGIGAYAGAVDILTHRHSTGLEAELQGGMHGYYFGALSGGYSSDAASVHASASVRHSDGYVHNTAFTNYNGFIYGDLHLTRTQNLELQAGYQNRRFGANGFYSRAFPEQYEKTTTALGSATWSLHSGGLTLNASAGYRYNTDCFQLIRGDESRVPYNHHLTDNISTHADAAYNFGAPGETELSFDMIYNHIYSTVLGELRSHPKRIHGIDYNHSKSRTAINARLRHRVTLDALTADVAGGLSHSDYGTDGLWSAAVSYQFPLVRLSAGAVESMRLPTFTDLYYTATGYESDRDLKPEHATTFNIAGYLRNGPWDARIYTYYRHGRNVIDWVRPAPDANMKSMQVTRINTLGAELSAGYSASGWLRNARVTYGYIHQSASVPPTVISTYAFDHLRNKLVMQLEMAPVRPLTISLTGSILDREGNFMGRDGRVEKCRPYFLLDARVTYTWRMLRFYADATNLTATRYYDFGGLEMPRCWASGGIIVTIR